MNNSNGMIRGAVSPLLLTMAVVVLIAGTAHAQRPTEVAVSRVNLADSREISNVGAGEFVKAAAERTFASLGGDDITDNERAERFRMLLLETFDLPKIARFTLGRYWRRASEAQRVEFVQLFEDFIVLAYSNRFKGLSKKKFRISSVRKLSGTESLVASEIVISGRAPVRASWRVRGDRGTYKVTDVVIEGISMSVTQRDEFAAVIRSSGGRVDGLLHALRKKTGKS